MIVFTNIHTEVYFTFVCMCKITQASLDLLPLFLWWRSCAWMLSSVNTCSEAHTLVHQSFLILLSVDSIFSLNMKQSRPQKVWLRISTCLWTLHLSPHTHTHTPLLTPLTSWKQHSEDFGFMECSYASFGYRNGIRNVICIKKYI